MISSLSVHFLNAIESPTLPEESNQHPKLKRETLARPRVVKDVTSAYRYRMFWNQISLYLQPGELTSWTSPAAKSHEPPSQHAKATKRVAPTNAASTGRKKANEAERCALREKVARLCVLRHQYRSRWDETPSCMATAPKSKEELPPLDVRFLSSTSFPHCSKRPKNDYDPPRTGCSDTSARTQRIAEIWYPASGPGSSMFVLSSKSKPHIGYMIMHAGDGTGIEKLKRLSSQDSWPDYASNHQNLKHPYNARRAEQPCAPAHQALKLALSELARRSGVIVTGVRGTSPEADRRRQSSKQELSSDGP
ncbi:uncharacterized protein PITG_04596 [Phytophthora infestans T30-4]|uniref:Uncharacterized protein n=1 Tax=Phytophthora infestans (strain T30-4) TaxID=403677 RepID=D0N1L3_PHYIT|nr:uncharacterized protein PITG_04596 [Phytophthora infestans T30-4]EEY68192.1 hypothetical protein PITG_04596 [Phytophthora infestans T30-4]|eukprot:XP_002905351.1 hypothetical protein PITG_04596 [Phytophthora infestans T30-4]